MVASVGEMLGTSVAWPTEVMSASVDDEPDHGGDDRKQHRGHGAEREEQDHDGGREADRLARSRSTASRASGRHSRRPRGRGRRPSPDRRRRGSAWASSTLVAPDPMSRRDRDVADRAVLAEEPGGAGVERAHDPDDVRRRLQVLDGGVDRALLFAVAERPVRIAERERDAPVRLLGQLRLEQVGRPRRPGPRERQVVVPVLAGAGGEEMERRGDDEPGGDHRPAEAHTSTPQPVEDPRHRAIILAGPPAERGDTFGLMHSHSHAHPTRIRATGRARHGRSRSRSA